MCKKRGKESSQKTMVEPNVLRMVDSYAMHWIGICPFPRLNFHSTAAEIEPAVLKEIPTLNTVILHYTSYTSVITSLISWNVRNARLK